jgi:hypothetical protein
MMSEKEKPGRMLPKTGEREPMCVDPEIALLRP